MKKILNIIFILCFIFINNSVNAESFSYDDAVYLAKKSLIVVEKSKVDALYKAGTRTGAVDLLFSNSGLNYDEYNSVLSGITLGTGTYIDQETYKYYLLKKSYDPYNAKSKLFLLFEDIFSVDVKKQKDILLKDIEDTHNLIYDNMFGSYKDLIKKLLFNGNKGDYSISKYLDLLDQKNPQRPNENYSRELLQLFLMGEYKPLEIGFGERNYTEIDVNRLAKILIGFKSAPNNKVIFDPSINTNDYVQFLSGSFSKGDNFSFVTGENNDVIDIEKIKKSINGNNGLPDNIIDYIFSKREKPISLFLADKLYRFYVGENPSNIELELISNKIIQEDFVILPVVKWLLSSDIFYNHKNEVLFKNPIELVGNLIKQLNIKKSSVLYNLKDLNWIPYLPGTIFGRNGFDDNNIFFTPSIGLAWTFVSADFAKEFAYNIFSNDLIHITNFLGNDKIFDRYNFIRNRKTFNSNKVSYITGHIDLNNIKIGLNVLSGGKVFLGEKKINVNGDLYLYDSFSIDFNKMEIYFSGSETYTGSIEFLNIIRGYTPEEIIFYFENKFYVDKNLNNKIKNKIINFLEKDNIGNNVKFDSRDRYKIFATIWFLLNQPEYILKSGYYNIEENGNISRDLKKLDNKKLILFRLAGGFDPLSVYIPKNQYIEYKDLRGEGALLKNELHEFGTDYYINKTLTGFIDLLNNKDLYIINRIGVPDHGRGHDYAMRQMASYNASASKNNLGILGKILSSTSVEDTIVIHPSYTPAILNGAKFLGVGEKSYIYKNDEKTKSLLEDIFLARNYPIGLKGIYDKMLLLNNVSNNLYNKLGKYSYSIKDESKLDYVEELVNQDLGKIISVPIFGGYDVHSNSKSTMNKRFSYVVNLITKFYNNIKNNNDITIVIYSEFGRTLRLNTSKGTDHGNGGTMFIITNNKKLKNKLKTQFIGNLNFIDSESNWLGVGIDNRAIWKVILDSLYSIDISNELPGDYYLTGYIDNNFGDIISFSRTVQDGYGRMYFNFKINDINFIPKQASYIKLEYGTDFNNMFEESQYRLNNMDICKDKLSLSGICNVNLKLFDIKPETKYYYRITLYDNQYNKKILTGSFVSAKNLPNSSFYILNTDTDTSINQYYSGFIGGKLNKKIYLSFSGTKELVGENNSILVDSGTYIKSIDVISSDIKWRGGFILPKDINPDIFLDKNLLIDGYRIKDLNIGKLIKLGSDIPGIKLNLNKQVYIILYGLDINKKYKLYTSQDGEYWIPHNGLLLEDNKFKIKTSHFSYYLLLEVNNNGEFINNKIKNNGIVNTTIEKTNKDKYYSGGGPILIKDNCPYGDFSESYYDKTCGYDPYYEWAMANISQSMDYIKRKFRMDLEKYSDKEDDKFHYILKDLVNLKEFDKLIESAILKLIKTKYLLNYKLLYLDDSKYEKYNKLFDRIARFLINKDYKRNSIKTKLIDILNSIIIYFAVYKEEPSLKEVLKPLILEKINKLNSLYSKNLIIKNKNNNIQYSNISNENYLYKVKVRSVKLKKDPYWKYTNAYLYYGDLLEQLTLPHKKGFFKVRVLKSRDGYKGVEGYIFLKYLEKLKNKQD